MAIISLTSTGIKDFFIQRVTAVIITIYFSYIIAQTLYLSHLNILDYDNWRILFTNGIFIRIATLMAYLAIFFHAWVGIWIICGDYIKCACISASVMLSFILVYIFCFFWLFIVLFFY